MFININDDDNDSTDYSPNAQDKINESQKIISNQNFAASRQSKDGDLCRKSERL